MRNRRSIIIGVCCGLLSAACVFLYMLSIQRNAEAERADALRRYGGEQVEICVAKQPIAPGDSLSDSNVEKRMWVAALLPDGAVSSIADVGSKKATSPILAGEVISTKRFEFQAGDFNVPDGFEALSVPTESVKAVGGAVSPGTLVDVYIVGGSSTDLLARGVPVLATSGASAMGGDVSWITLAVKPETVQEFITASEKSSLYLVLPGQSAADSQNQKSSNDQKNSKSQVQSSTKQNEKDSTGSASKTSTHDADTSQQGSADARNR